MRIPSSPALRLLQQRGDEFNQRHVFDGPTMADDAHLDRSRRISNKSDVLDISTGGHQWRRDGQKSVPGADRIDDGLGEGRDARDTRLHRERITTERAVRDDNVVAVDFAMESVLDHGGNITE